ncbi:MAG: chemotaxis protein CheB [Myxococcales bacterium]
MPGTLISAPVRVVIADDSAIAVSRLAQLLSEEAGIVVVGTANSADELEALVDKLKPDAVTLDILMPERPGLSAIRGLSTRTQVVVVSDIESGSALAGEALAQGAALFVSKRELGSPAGAARLVRALLQHAQAPRPLQLVAIAGSTGAMPALEQIIPDLADCPAAFVIVQHLPAARMPAFAEWICELGLPSETLPGARALRPGMAWVAPGDRHLRVVGSHATLDDGEPVMGHKPSATVMVSSLVRLAARTTLIILSGMGSDGASAVPAFVAAGGKLVVQQPSTCAVPGMPEAALAASPRCHELGPREIGRFVTGSLSARRHV